MPRPIPKPPAKRGRPAGGVDSARLTALQADLLSQAAKAGVPVAPEAVDKAAAALAKFTTRDVRVLDVLTDSPLALEAMAQLAVDNPDAFLRHYATFLEFSKPKLARVEHQHEGMNLGVFVAVEQREPGPPPALRGKVVSEQ